MPEERPIRLSGIYKDDGYLRFFRQSHRPGLIDPFSELADSDGRTCSGRLPGEVGSPMLAEHEMCRVQTHFTQQKRVGNLAEERSKRFVDGQAAVRSLRRLMDLLEYLLEVR